jgi:hypothetical protein
MVNNTTPIQEKSYLSKLLFPFQHTRKGLSEEIVVAPDLPREGELTESTLPMGSDSWKRKRRIEEEYSYKS